MLNYKLLTQKLIDKSISSAKLSALLEQRGIVLGKDSIDAYRKGRVKNPKLEVLMNIADIADLTIAELFLDFDKEKEKIVKDELSKNLTKYSHYISASVLPGYVKKIKLLDGYIGAGSLGEMENKRKDIFVDIDYIEKTYKDKELEALRVIGDSMYPYVDSGDIVLFYRLKSDENFNKSDGRYIIRTPDGFQVKNIKFLLNGNIRIISENPKYHTNDGYDEEIDKESQEYLEIVGKVAGRILKG